MVTINYFAMDSRPAEWPSAFLSRAEDLGKSLGWYPPSSHAGLDIKTLDFVRRPH